MKKVSLLIVGCSFLSGCATSYQSLGLGGGYSEMQLNQNTYQVSARGNGYTSQGRVDAIVLRRSAELTLNNGFKYFIILSGGSQQMISQYVTSNATATTMGSAYASGNWVNYNQTTTYKPANVITTHRIYDNVTISMGNDYSPNALDAAIIMRETSFLASNS